MINTVLMPSGPGRELRHSEWRFWKAGHLESPSRAVSGIGRGEGMGEDWTARGLHPYMSSFSRTLRPKMAGRQAKTTALLQKGGPYGQLTGGHS